MGKIAKTHHPETGEIGLFVPLDGGHKVISSEQSNAFKRQKKLEEYKSQNKGKKWVACFHHPIREVSKKLTLIEAGALIRLIFQIQFKSGGKLIKNGQPLQKKDIQKLIGRGKDATSDILKRLEQLNILRTEKHGKSHVYFISPEFHVIGETMKKIPFTKLYQVRTKELISDLSLNQAGLLYKILPYFHFQTYYLCDNPDEPDPDVICHLSREKLAENIGHDVATVTNYMKALQDKGIIMQCRSMKTETYLVNPDVMFRKESEDEYTQVIRKQFEEIRAKRSREKP